jgi:hypothetical protein
MYSAPATTGGLPVTQYVITQTVVGSAPTTVTVAAPSDRKEITGLTASTAYTFTVTAQNSLGGNLASDVLTVTTLGTQAVVPLAPHSMSVLVKGPTYYTLQWVAPLSNGGAAITGYVLQGKDQASATWSNLYEGTNTQFEVLNLVNTNTYDFRVYAKNSVGQSVSAATLQTVIQFANIVPDAPDAPTELRDGTRTSSALTVTWNVPSRDGGSPITNYQVQWKLLGSTGPYQFQKVTENKKTFTSTQMIKGS